MKKCLALLLGLCLALECACASASSFGELQNMLRSGTAEDASAANPGADSLMTFSARDGLSILDGNCILNADDYSSFIDCYVYAVVSNTGSSPVAVDGQIVVTDAQGNTLEEQAYVFPTPDVLAPGETAVIAEELLISKTDGVTLPEHVAGVALSVYADPYAYSTEAPVQAQVAAELTQGVDAYGFTVDVVRFTITNSTGAPLRNPMVTAALYDTEGRLVLTVNGNTGYDTVILPEGGTLIIESELYSFVADYLAQAGRTLATVEAVAFGN
ncbi:MAG: hypothetical protein ACI4ML_09265 [Aristaeellaceae bacterium]